MKSYSTIFFFILLCFILPAKKTLANDSTQEARKLFDQAVDSYSKGEFHEALRLFEQAYNTASSYRLFYNIAQTHLELHQNARALDAFERYLVEGGSWIEEGRKSEVFSEIKKLRKIVGELIILSKTGSELRLNNIHAGYLPIDKAVRLDPDQYLISIYIQGELICQKSVEVVSGKRRIETCKAKTSDQEGPDEPSTVWELMAETSLGSIEIESTHSTTSSKPLDIALASTITTGAVSLASATIFAIITARINKDLNRKCTNGICPEEYFERINRLENFAKTADIMFITSALATGAATALFIIKKRKSSAKANAFEKAH